MCSWSSYNATDARPAAGRPGARARDVRSRASLRPARRARRQLVRLVRAVLTGHEDPHAAELRRVGRPEDPVDARRAVRHVNAGDLVVAVVLVREALIVAVRVLGGLRVAALRDQALGPLP